MINFHMLSKNAENKEGQPLDAQWYQELLNASGSGAVDLLKSGNEAVEKEKFIASDSTNPSLDFPKIFLDELNEREKKLGIVA